MRAVQGGVRWPVRGLRRVSRLPHEDPVVLLPGEGESLQPRRSRSHFPAELPKFQRGLADPPGANNAAHNHAAAHMAEADRPDGLCDPPGQAGVLGEDDQAGGGEGAGRENAQKMIYYKI